MVDYQPNQVLATKEFKVVGSRPIRHDGADKVTGQAKYGADIQLPGLLFGKILRSPYAHARIKSIDVSKALALPGVHAVVTADDWEQPSGKVEDLAEGSIHNLRFLSNNVLAYEKVLYKGHAIAGVAAEGAHLAEQAAALIEVDYEVLPPVVNFTSAMADDAPILHERLESLSNPGLRSGGYKSDSDDSKGTNVANRFDFKLGDIERGFNESDVIVEKTVGTAAVHQGYIEPHTGTAMWNTDGSLTVWSSTQGHFNVRDLLSRMLGMPVSKIRVIPMEIGGGFGAKGIVYSEPVAALLAKKANRPVKVTMSRTEVFEASGPTSGTNISVKLGATKDGKLLAAEAHLIYESGAFPGSPVPGGCNCIFAPYDIPNTFLEGVDVVVNRPKAAAYRAPGAPAAAFAMETAVDELCDKLGMDPLEFRLLNGAKEGTRRATGPLMPSVGIIETLQAAKEHDHYRVDPGGTVPGPRSG